MPDYFSQKQQNTYSKEEYGFKTVMVFFSAMVERVNAHYKSKTHHKILKTQVVYNVYAKEWKGAQKQGQNGTVNSTCY
jgi:hypothetical protein